VAGIALAVLAIFSYRVPAEASSASEPCGSSPTGYGGVPYINGCEIPVTIGFLVLAAAMRWILTAPKRPAARPVERL
jgi:hypothetical protein